MFGTPSKVIIDVDWWIHGYMYIIRKTGQEESLQEALSFSKLKEINSKRVKGYSKSTWTCLISMVPAMELGATGSQVYNLAADVQSTMDYGLQTKYADQIADSSLLLQNSQKHDWKKTSTFLSFQNYNSTYIIHYIYIQQLCIREQWDK